MADYGEFGPLMPQGAVVFTTGSNTTYKAHVPKLVDITDDEAVAMCETYCREEWGLEMVKFQRISVRMFMAALRKAGVRIVRECK